MIRNIWFAGVAAFAMIALYAGAQTGDSAAKVPGGKGVTQWGDSPDGIVKDGKPVAKEWKSLFDGKTLKGWVGEKGYWQVKDGAIVGDKGGKTDHHHYLFSDKDYSDFEIHIDCKMVGYNSGVC